MRYSKTIGKRDFIQHTSKYIKWVEEHGTDLVITHHNRPDLILSKIKPKSLKDLRGIVTIKIHGDVNESVLQGYDEW
jgi:antitoxin (DNA-binding transcriptional repressor) of toxin-antitoxin stability system